MASLVLDDGQQCRRAGHCEEELHCRDPRFPAPVVRPRVFTVERRRGFA
jgi:hypothetical protein